MFYYNFLFQFFEDFILTYIYSFTSLPNLNSEDRCSTAKKILLCHAAYFGSQRHNVAELQTEFTYGEMISSRQQKDQLFACHP